MNICPVCGREIRNYDPYVDNPYMDMVRALALWEDEPDTRVRQTMNPYICDECVLGGNMKPINDVVFWVL